MLYCLRPGIGEVGSQSARSTGCTSWHASKVDRILDSTIHLPKSTQIYPLPTLVFTSAASREGLYHADGQAARRALFLFTSLRGPNKPAGSRVEDL